MVFTTTSKLDVMFSNGDADMKPVSRHPCRFIGLETLSVGFYSVWRRGVGRARSSERVLGGLPPFPLAGPLRFDNFQLPSDYLCMWLHNFFPFILAGLLGLLFRQGETLVLRCSMPDNF